MIEFNTQNQTSKYFLTYKQGKTFWFKSKDEATTIHITPHYCDYDAILKDYFIVFVSTVIEKDNEVTTKYTLTAEQIIAEFGIDVDDECFNVDGETDKISQFIEYVNLLQSDSAYNKLKDAKNFDEFKATLDGLLGWNLDKCNEFFLDLNNNLNDGKFNYDEAVDRGLSKVFGFYYGGEEV